MVVQTLIYLKFNKINNNNEYTIVDDVKVEVGDENSNINNAIEHEYKSRVKSE